MFPCREINIKLCQSYTKTCVYEIWYNNPCFKQILFSKYATDLKTTVTKRSLKNLGVLLSFPAVKLFFLSTVFLFSTVIGTLFFIRKCLFVELRHRMIKSCLFLVHNCLLSEFDSIVGSKLIYQSVC